MEGRSREKELEVCKKKTRGNVYRLQLDIRKKVPARMEYLEFSLSPGTGFSVRLWSFYLGKALNNLRKH